MAETAQSTAMETTKADQMESASSASVNEQIPPPAPTSEVVEEGDLPDEEHEEIDLDQRTTAAPPVDNSPAAASICELKIQEKSAACLVDQLFNKFNDLKEKEKMAEEEEYRCEKEIIKETFTEFDPNCFVYKTAACCELLHCRSAALVLAGVEFICLMAWGVLAVAIYNQGLTNGPALTVVMEVIVVVALATVCLMVYGIVTEKPRLLWPHMIMLISMVVLGIALTVIAVLCMSVGPALVDPVFAVIFDIITLEKIFGPIYPFTLAVLFDFGAAIAIWFYVVVRGCYEFMLDKEYFAENPGALIVLPVKCTVAEINKQ